MPEGPQRLDPILTRDSAFYWEAAKNGDLVCRICTNCSHAEHPPVPMCPKCHGVAWREKKLSGKGKVKSWMKVHYPPTPFFEYPIPVVVVELDEGLEIVSNLVGGDKIEDGMRVEVAFAPTKGGWAVPVFRQAS
jgi:uncharacterized OB-fold protein